MELIFVLLPLFFLILRAASEFALVVIAYVAYKFMKLYIPMGAPVWDRIKRALKAF